MTLIAEDLPELERPTKAISAPISSGHSVIFEALFKNFVLLKYISNKFTLSI